MDHPLSGCGSFALSAEGALRLDHPQQAGAELEHHLRSKQKRHALHPAEGEVLLSRESGSGAEHTQ